jgi:hypothetical protein
VITTLLGLHLSGDVDATGLATVLLAVATFGLAIYTRQSVRQNAVELEQSQRPVLVPLIERVADRPKLQDDRFLLPIINVGVGPAMAIRADLEFGDIHAEPTAAPYVAASTERTAIGASQQTYLEFENVALSGVTGFAYNIEFADVSGRKWLSRGFYSEAEHCFRDVEIVSGGLSKAQRFRIHPRVGHA